MAIVLFASPGCAHCSAARAFLAERGTAYLARDPSKDRAALRRLVELTGRASVPTLAVGRDVMMGFDREQWAEMLDRA
jgi:glutaredoxin